MSFALYRARVRTFLLLFTSAMILGFSAVTVQASETAPRTKPTFPVRFLIHPKVTGPKSPVLRIGIHPEKDLIAFDWCDPKSSRVCLRSHHASRGGEVDEPVVFPLKQFESEAGRVIELSARTAHLPYYANIHREAFVLKRLQKLLKLGPVDGGKYASEQVFGRRSTLKIRAALDQFLELGLINAQRFEVDSRAFGLAPPVKPECREVAADWKNRGHCRKPKAAKSFSLRKKQRKSRAAAVRNAGKPAA